MSLPARFPSSLFVFTIFVVHFCEAYWLMAPNNIITTQRLDPVVSPGAVSTHAHSVLGGSNFGLNISTAVLRDSSCTSIPIPEDKSNYWFPQMYFQWANGSFTSVSGNAVILFVQRHSWIYYGISGGFPNAIRRSNPSRIDIMSCPGGISCPSGIRSQINFPSCWNGKDTDSRDHKSHVAFLSTGPDNGTCNDPAFPVTLPRIFMEVYWISQVFDDQRKNAMTPSQPFVFAHGDPTGYGYHADFFNGWDSGVLQRALNGCNCNPYGDPTCCVNQGIFGMNKSSVCYITETVDEQTLGTLETLPGNNPIQAPCYQTYIDPVTPAILSPVYVYNGSTGGPTGTVVIPAQTAIVTQTANGSCIRKGSAISSKRPSWLHFFAVLAPAVGSWVL
ncbi:Wsc domain [Mycena venus]|uniref:Wsc domain n=1 Tax=Mycena venus TaxID=2733690 RepID=A0A8H6WRA0_9AGAR|nr:Wsc domain [Mycena venus]